MRDVVAEHPPERSPAARAHWAWRVPCKAYMGMVGLIVGAHYMPEVLQAYRPTSVGGILLVLGALILILRVALPRTPPTP